MKKTMAMMAFWVIAMAATAQVKFGIKGGYTSTDLNTNDFTIQNQEGRDAFTIAVKEANYGFQFGTFLQAKMGNFFIQPEVTFNTNKVDFLYQDVMSLNEQIFSERYNTLDIPILMGLKLGPLRLGIGPVGHVNLSSSGSIFNIPDYKENFQDLTLGYQAGAGLDIWRLTFDLRYEGNFSQFGDHMTIGNQQIDFNQTPSRVIGTVGWKF